MSPAIATPPSDPGTMFSGRGRSEGRGAPLPHEGGGVAVRGGGSQSAACFPLALAGPPPLPSPLPRGVRGYAVQNRPVSEKGLQPTGPAFRLEHEEVPLEVRPPYRNSNPVRQVSLFQLLSTFDFSPPVSNIIFLPPGVLPSGKLVCRKSF